ncbi:unnamed protein product [Adineta steineri]|uniref:Uncharacterized protein n=1 Tax=Adineta steineri TaxID=433720 RepID=A0A819YNY4_9BILA|nr:unnamed protein product [Adineta steineri]
MNNNGLFKGDRRTLKDTGDHLGLDQIAMVTVADWTPRLSSLKPSATCDIRQFKHYRNQQLNSSSTDNNLGDSDRL